MSLISVRPPAITFSYGSIKPWCSITQPEPLRENTARDASIIRNWWTSPFAAAYQSAHVNVHRHSVPADHAGNHATGQPGGSHGARHGYGRSAHYRAVHRLFCGTGKRGLRALHHRSLPG